MIEATQVISLLLSVISIASVIYLAGVKLATLEVKVDTMWAFQMRRALSESVEKGIATMNSPLRFGEDAQRRLDTLKPKLVEFWDARGSKMQAAEALLEIERVFGDDLFSTVCVPCKLSHGACLIIAYAVARQQPVVDVPL